MRNVFLFTDQSRCYDIHGLEIPCTGQGQDASDHARPETRLLASKERFRQRNDLVHDTLSSFTWALDANLPEYPLAWDDAHTYIADLNTKAFGGTTNWQLPSRRALFSLISHQNVNPALPTRHPFKNVFPGYYWTADTCSRLPDQAWYLHLGGGRVFRGMKHGAYLTWPVIISEHSAVNLPAERFLIGNSLAFDHDNQLTWLFDHHHLKAPFSWGDALKMIQKMNHEKWYGCDLWRLPNIRELESLVDIRQNSPAILQSLTQFEIKSGYWSSTTSAYEPRYAWVLYTRDGEVGVGFKRKSEFFMIALTSERLY
jgi:hypothetical protein